MEQAEETEAQKDPEPSESPASREARIAQAVGVLRQAEAVRADARLMAEIQAWLIQQAQVAGDLLGKWFLPASLPAAPQGVAPTGPASPNSDLRLIPRRRGPDISQSVSAPAPAPAPDLIGTPHAR